MPFAGETGTVQSYGNFLAFLTSVPNPSIDHAASELANLLGQATGTVRNVS